MPDQKQAIPLRLLTVGIVLSSCAVLAEQPIPYAHANEPIGTVRQIYDGTLYPDLAVNTFRNTDRLFPTRLVRRGKDVHELPTADEQLTNFKFMSGDQEYDLHHRTSGQDSAALPTL